MLYIMHLKIWLTQCSPTNFADEPHFYERNFRRGMRPSLQGLQLSLKRIIPLEKFFHVPGNLLFSGQDHIQQPD